MNKQRLMAMGLCLGLMLGFTGVAHATANCFCKIACANIAGQTSAGNSEVKSYTTNLSWPTQIDGNGNKKQNCSNVCSDLAKPDVNSPAVAAACCAKGFATGSIVRAYSAVGTKEYDSASTIGTLINTPAVTQQKCPTGWASNTTNVDGGVTPDGKCKKLACGPNTVSPPPADWTAIGTWGFSGGSSFYAWGTSANQGAPITTIISPAVCKWQ